MHQPILWVSRITRQSKKRLRHGNFVHRPFVGLSPNQPGLQLNLLCRTDWLHLRATAETEGAILSIQEIVAYPWCSACENCCSKERPMACRSLPAPDPFNGLSWQSEQVTWSGSSGRADSPCSGQGQWLRPRNQTSGNGTWMQLHIVVALVYPDQYLSQRGHSGRGSFSESLSSPTPHPILAAPFVEVPSPNPTGFPSGGGGSRTPSVSSSWFRPLSTANGGALKKGPPLCRAKGQGTVHQSDAHPSPRSAHIIRARSILAHSSAAASQRFE